MREVGLRLAAAALVEASSMLLCMTLREVPCSAIGTYYTSAVCGNCGFFFFNIARLLLCLGKLHITIIPIIQFILLN